MPEITPPKPNPQNNVTLEEYINFYHKILPHTLDGKNDCTLASLSSAAITQSYFMYRDDIDSYLMNKTFIKVCREFLENEAKPYRSPGQSLSIGWLVQKMKEYNKTLFVKEGDVEYSFKYNDIVKIEVNPEKWQETYFSKGRQVSLEINSWAFDSVKKMWKIDPTPHPGQIANGHAVTAFYMEKNGNVLVYDKDSETHSPGYPKGVKKLSADFARKDAKGNSNNEGVSNAWVFRPDYFPQ